MSKLTISTSTLPWIAAVALGGSVHVGWLAHDLLDRGSPQVLVVPAPAPTCTPTATPVAEVPEPTRDAKPGPRARNGARPVAKEASQALPGANEAIECSQERRCVIDRAFVQGLIANPSVLARQARIVPSSLEGEPQGYKIYGLRRDSLPKLLGLRNGDLVTAINGRALTSIEACMQAYTALRLSSDPEVEIKVDIVRKGQPFTLDIQIR